MFPKIDRMRLVLFQPDIPQNTGAMIRLAACFGVALDIIEPCGFVLDDRKLARAAMDYGARAEIARHDSWQAYQAGQPAGRLVLLTTKNATPLPAFAFAADDRLMLGRESAGVPEDVHAAADARVTIPMQPECRSLNVAQAAAIALFEALRQTGNLTGQLS
jgi:tRNA (cytidine/uridine-2'-O-)-methyltransferase